MMNKVLIPFIVPNVQFDVIATGDTTYPYRLVTSNIGDARQPYAPGLELQSVPSTTQNFQVAAPLPALQDINGLNLAVNGSFFINQAWGLVRQIEFVVVS
jgi:hypothetical protein